MVYISRVASTKCLVVITSEDLKWNKHVINKICKSIVLNKVRNVLLLGLLSIYCRPTLILPDSQYCNIVRARNYSTNLHKLYVLQKRTSVLSVSLNDVITLYYLKDSFIFICIYFYISFLYH